jgi:lysophospholipase L1-like esterase
VNPKPPAIVGCFAVVVFSVVFLLTTALDSLPSAARTAAGGAVPVTISKAPPLRVMAFGDSITAGVGANGSDDNSGGYRGALAKLLERDGYHIHFVGSRRDYSAAIDQPAHEGWPGYVLRSFPADPGPGELYGPLVREAMRTNDPDVILLMAGTNDLLRLQKGVPGYTLPNIIHSMDLLLDEIFLEKPEVRVIVAPVVASPRVDTCTLARFAGDQRCGSSGPDNLKTLVGAYAKSGYRVTLASEMASAVPRDKEHFPDGIHPCGAQGYADVAKAWLDAIEQVTRPVGRRSVATSR